MRIATSLSIFSIFAFFSSAAGAACFNLSSLINSLVTLPFEFFSGLAVTGFGFRAGLCSSGIYTKRYATSTSILEPALPKMSPEQKSPPSYPLRKTASSSQAELMNVSAVSARLFIFSSFIMAVTILRGAISCCAFFFRSVSSLGFSQE